MDQDQTTPRPRRRLRALVWVALASLLAVAMLGTSSAGSVATATGLHQTPPIASSDPGSQGTAEDCAGLNLPAGSILWHFVLVQTSATSGLLTVDFTGTANDQTVLSAKKTGSTLHFNVITTGGPTTLLGASTDVSGALLNLSHICQGVTTTTSTTTTTTTSSTTTTTTLTTTTTSTATTS
jgi:hypothetical protein